MRQLYAGDRTLFVDEGRDLRQFLDVLEGVIAAKPAACRANTPAAAERRFR